jgi:SAM-dependent methyltransferase
MSTDEEYAGNLDFWEKAATVHGTHGSSKHYRFDVIVAGGSLMTHMEEAAVAAATGGSTDEPLAGVRGLDVLYLQSHLGADGVVMARAGARVTCADFSATALRRARELAERVGVEIETVETDARALPESLHYRFDVVYVTVGAICWIDDLDLWMRQVSLALRPGGRLVLVDIHPLYQMVYDVEPELVIDFAYGGGTGVSDTEAGSYDAPDANFVSTTTCYAHSIGEIVTGAVRAGLRVDALEEHVAMAINPRGDSSVKQGDDGLFRLLIGRGRDEGSDPEPMPVFFTFLATKV